MVQPQHYLQHPYNAGGPQVPMNHQQHFQGHGAPGFGGQDRHHRGLAGPVSGPSPGTGMLGHVLSPPASTYPPGLVASVQVDFAQCTSIAMSTTLQGPNRDYILHATPGAMGRWFLPSDVGDYLPIRGLSADILPVHMKRFERLQTVVNSLPVECNAKFLIKESPPPARAGLKRAGISAVVLMNCPSPMLVMAREQVLRAMGGPLIRISFDVDAELFFDLENWGLKPNMASELARCSQESGADIFLSKPPPTDETTHVYDPDRDENQQLQKVRIEIFGDNDRCEYARTKVLLLIDSLMGLQIDVTHVEHKMQALICGKHRRTIKRLEATTQTSIYFPPPFPEVYGKVPEEYRRRHDEIFISGRNQSEIDECKKALGHLVYQTRIQARMIRLPEVKSDFLLLERLEDLARIMFETGTHIHFEPIGCPNSEFEVVGSDIQTIDKAIKSVMALAGSFYVSNWWILGEKGGAYMLDRMPHESDIEETLMDICAETGAEICFSKHVFCLTGLDEDVKRALEKLAEVEYLRNHSSQIQTRIELCNEHKEFVSGKKNGKLNKIMGISSVTINFHDFNEHDFLIEIVGSEIEYALKGIRLVELELPASVSFHVPDQYHKRIIGVGGAHIQAIMKKYSVFVKFTNAMEMNNADKDPGEPGRALNVICRTPARNASNLEAVKEEIMSMVMQEDAEIVTEKVTVPRELHRQLQSKIRNLQAIERQWGVMIIFPGAEIGSDSVYIKGPQWQIPKAIGDFLAMVPETYKIWIPSSKKLLEVIESHEFALSVKNKIGGLFNIQICFPETKSYGKNLNKGMKQVLFAYSRREAGGLEDCIEIFLNFLRSRGLWIPESEIRGLQPRPTTDWFWKSLPLFNGRVFSGPYTATTPNQSPLLSPSHHSRKRFSNSSFGSSYSDIRDPANMGKIEAAFHSGTGEVLDSFNTGNMRKASNGSLSSSASSAMNSVSSLTPSLGSTAASSISGEHTPSTSVSNLTEMGSATRFAANFHHARRMLVEGQRMGAMSHALPINTPMGLGIQNLPMQSLAMGMNNMSIANNISLRNSMNGAPTMMMPITPMPQMGNGLATPLAVPRDMMPHGQQGPRLPSNMIPPRRRTMGEYNNNLMN